MKSASPANISRRTEGWSSPVVLAILALCFSPTLGSTLSAGTGSVRQHGQACYQFRLPKVRIPKVKIPGIEDARIPGLDRFLKNEPALTTSIKDALTEAPFLDDFEPAVPLPMELLPRGDEGQFFLVLDGAFTFEAQSYCLHAGTHAPGRGEGYLFTPPKGPKAAIIQTILRRSALHPEISQQNVQVLLWAILARAKVRQMPGEIQATAAQLLTPQELTELQGDALDFLTEEARQKALRDLPDPVRRVLEAENRIRQMLTLPATNFQELERIAVLTGDPPFGERGLNVPRGRWSYHPDGYLVRFFPSGFSRTRVDLYSAEPVMVERDGHGRITRIADVLGNAIETCYDDAIEPVAIAGDPGVRAYAFRSVRFTHADFAEEEGGGEKRWENEGWVLVGSPDGNGRTPEAPPDRFPDLGRRYDTAVARMPEFDRLVKGIHSLRAKQRSGLPSTSEASLRDLMDLSHYHAALTAVIPAKHPSATTAQAPRRFGLAFNAWSATPVIAQESLEKAWAPGHLNLALNAWLATVNNGSMPTQDDACSSEPDGEFDPAGIVATPGQTGRQRLGQSSRSAPAAAVPDLPDWPMIPPDWDLDNLTPQQKEAIRRARQLPPRETGEQARERYRSEHPLRHLLDHLRNMTKESNPRLRRGGCTGIRAVRG